MIRALTELENQGLTMTRAAEVLDIPEDQLSRIVQKAARAGRGDGSFPLLLDEARRFQPVGAAPEPAAPQPAPPPQPTGPGQRPPFQSREMALPGGNAQGDARADIEAGLRAFYSDSAGLPKKANSPQYRAPSQRAIQALRNYHDPHLRDRLSRGEEFTLRDFENLPSRDQVEIAFRLAREGVRFDQRGNLVNIPAKELDWQKRKRGR